MSGYSARVLDERRLAETDAAFMHKPFASADLARVVRTLLDPSENPPPLGSARTT
jgi:hypothetical protein